jgi:hypothetical protein
MTNDIAPQTAMPFAAAPGAAAPTAPAPAAEAAPLAMSDAVHSGMRSITPESRINWNDGDFPAAASGIAGEYLAEWNGRSLTWLQNESAIMIHSHSEGLLPTPDALIFIDIPGIIRLVEFTLDFHEGRLTLNGTSRQEELITVTVDLNSMEIVQD